MKNFKNKNNNKERKNGKCKELITVLSQFLPESITVYVVGSLDKKKLRFVG